MNGVTNTSINSLKVVVVISLSIFGLYTLMSQLFLGEEGRLLAQRNIFYNSDLPAVRGLIYDRNGIRLVSNSPVYDLILSPSGLEEEHYDLIKDQLSEMGFSLELEYTEAKGLKEVVIKRGVEIKQVIEVEERLQNESIKAVRSSLRKYNFPKSTSSIIGYTGAVTKEDVDRGYDYVDRIGKFGLEAAFESELRGVDGRTQVQGAVVENLPAVPGSSLVLTIDQKWQSTLYKILSRRVLAANARSGTAAIMDIKTGEVLAMVDYPSFDSNFFERGISISEYNQYIKNKGKPLIQKNIGIQAPPGSAFKIATAYGLLEEGVIDSSYSIISQGCIQLGSYPFCEFGKYSLGELNIESALYRSSNIFFCQASLRAVRQKGYDLLYDRYKSLGLGSPTGIELLGELSGVLPNPDYKVNTFSERWFSGDTCNTSIGQGMVLVTPLQMLRATAIILNGGRVVTPRLIKEIDKSSSGDIEENGFEISSDLEISKVTNQLIRSGMKGTVNNPQGTGYRVLNGVAGNMVAKTGSAEATEYISGKRREGVHGWVVGSFRYNNREYAFVVHLHFGGGGWNATPVIKRFVNCLYADFKGACKNG